MQVEKNVNWCACELPDPSLGATHCEAEKDNGEEGDITITFFRYQVSPNRNYKKELAQYNKKLAAFKRKKEEWDSLLKKWNESRARQETSQRRKLYRRLKKEFEK